jgi:quercetin dioxygenase-like cupin family protein
MSKQRIVIQPGQGPVPSFTPARVVALKLLSGATDDSIMLFEETIRVGTRSTLHLHHDSDEVAYVLSGEVTFHIDGGLTSGGAGTSAFTPRGVPHAWKSTGAEAGRVLLLYTLGKAGGFIDEQQQTGRTPSPMIEGERAEICERHGWELLGSSPL